MTHFQRYIQNKVMIKRDLAFLPECKTDRDRLKLIGEIARLRLQNRHIAKMNDEAAKEETHEYTIERPSNENQIKTHA